MASGVATLKCWLPVGRCVSAVLSRARLLLQVPANSHKTGNNQTSYTNSDSVTFQKRHLIYICTPHKPLNQNHCISLLKQGSDLQAKSCSSTTTNLIGKGDDAIDFAALGQQVMEVAVKVDVMASTIPVINAVSLLKELHALGFQTDKLVHTLSQKIWLLYNPAAAVGLFQTLRAHGFSHGVVVKVIEHISVADRNISIQNLQTLITTSLEHLRMNGFSEKDLQISLNSEPGLVLISPKVFTSMVKKLKSLFTTCDVFNLIRGCPNILTNPWAETHKIFDYAFFTMRYEQAEIVKTKLFSHTFEHIQDRHLFLVRVGIFVTVKSKISAKMNPNPPLHEIVDSSVKYFVRKFGGFHVDDYLTFLRMREIERENEDEMSSEEAKWEVENDESESSEEKFSNRKSKKGKK